VIVSTASDDDRDRLFAVWEASVRATHDFLREQDVQALIPRVRAILAVFDPIDCVRGTDGAPIAFMGVAGTELSMLFVHPDHRGMGVGRTLAEHAIAAGAATVDVNEQNAQAVGFYERLGFVVVGRSERDSDGKPFPILHMALARAR
jgi:putative acetyltransferase